MKTIYRWIIVVLTLIGLSLTACTSKSESPKKVEPATLEEIDGTDFKRVILTEKAAQRIDVQTTEVSGNILPYAAVIYDTEGNTWIYTNPEPLTYVRAPILVDHIDGDQAFLTEGLDAGTKVVTLGVAEIYGAETGVSK
jgi:hypothetical protein